ncbi:MAG TPA: tRNA preQ1(34) S-adenosylmethionine ribosyltransferase-isomerase QueA [Polyangia bacterium]|nr:tRNA preQ1(34) S-adenosylmethionine ribosyltransferase-isomerase QueA [Polyangia bacterium]
MRTDLFDYRLPPELIALHPASRRDGSRLLVLAPDGNLACAGFDGLPGLLPRRSLLVANDTRVIPARLRGRRPTGGAVELLLVREVETGGDHCRWTALASANKPLRPGDEIDFGGPRAEIVERGERGEVLVRIDLGSAGFREHVAAAGEVPLPPYLRRSPEPDDRTRYQTVFAREDGSVAAPTAGLHFTPELMERLVRGGHELAMLTLHVGPGTFRPIVADDLAGHAMDSERYAIPAATVAMIRAARDEGRPVIAVGTTVVRALEGAAVANGGWLEPGAGETALFIAPPFEFCVIDGLLTNFHLPRSTLLCLVAALAGREHVLAAYEWAVAKRMRFYSYGDAMLILPRGRRATEGTAGRSVGVA